MRVDVVQPINDVVVGVNASDSVINLFENFDDPFTTGQVATFEVNNPEEFGNNGQIQLLLFDQTGEGAPIATERFVSLINDGSFDNLIVNRGDVGFVIQAGQFTLDPATLAVGVVPEVPEIQGQPSPERSNTQGTIAFALSGLPDGSGTDPNSATSQFFLNLGDNSFLDLDFTVFGEVLSAADFEVVEAISNDPVFAPFQDPGELGFIDGSVDLNDVIFFSDISIAQQDELTFTATSSNPELVVPSIEGGNLTLDFVDGQTGTADVIVEATNLLGTTTSETFSVEVSEDIVVNPPSDVNLDLDGDGLVPSVDILNIFRVLAGAPQAVVIPDSVAIDQQTIADAVDGFGDLDLDVDNSGVVESSVDILNIFRVLAGAPQAVVVADGVSQQDVVNAVNALTA